MLNIPNLILEYLFSTMGKSNDLPFFIFVLLYKKSCFRQKKR